MVALTTEDLFYPAVVSFIAALQLARFTRRVGEARGKYKIPVPRTDGDQRFTRIFRAQQNTLEFYPIFLTLLWISSIFLHNVIPSVFGLLYLCARYKYFYGYADAGEKRLPGLRWAINILMALLVLSILGLVAHGYTKYTGRIVDMKFYADQTIEFAKPAVDRIKESYEEMNTTLEPYLKSAKAFITDCLSTLKTQYFSSYFQEPAKQTSKREL